MTEKPKATHAAVPLPILQAALAVLQTELPMAKVRQVVEALEASPTMALDPSAKPGDQVTPEAADGQG